MSKKSWMFYKGEHIASLPFIQHSEYKEGTYCFNSESIYPWTRLIRVRAGLVWAKVALRNVPKQYRGLLLLLKD